MRFEIGAWLYYPGGDWQLWSGSLNLAGDTLPQSKALALLTLDHIQKNAPPGFTFIDGAHALVPGPVDYALKEVRVEP